MYGIKDVIRFQNELDQCNEKLCGEAKFNVEWEPEIESIVNFDKFGHATITGYFQENCSVDYILKFHIESDQTFIGSIISELKAFVQKHY